jgi:alpha-1,6-mannosyltransferase
MLLTSRHEAHSVAMNEALAIGLPLVITESVGFEEVQKCGAGMIVPARPDAIADAVASLLQRPRETVAAAARKLAADRFAWPQIAQAILRAYAKVMESRKQ